MATAKKGEVKEEEININTDELNKEVEEVEVTEFPYDNLVMSISDFLKQLGQMQWMNDNEPAEEGEKSKTISIVRVLSSGEKQKFSVTIEEKNELKFK